MTPAPRERLTGLRLLAHAAFVILGWIIFVWLWWRVSGQPWESRDLRQLVLWSALLFPLVSGLWIRHNINIFRRKGPRRAVAVGPLHYELDFYGRRVEADWSALQRTQRVVIEIEDGVKRYRADPRSRPA